MSSKASTSSNGNRNGNAKQPPVAAGVYPVESVKDVAESANVNSLPEDVAVALAGDVEYRLHQVVEEAIKFMRHGKRNKLKTEDIDYSLQALNIEPLYGFLPSHSFTFRKAKIPGTSAPNREKERARNGLTAPPDGSVYFIEDEEIDFETVLSTPVAGAGRGMGWSAHWLAVEGVQPAIPQNPAPPTASTLQPSTSTRAGFSASTTHALSISHPTHPNKPTSSNAALSSPNANNKVEIKPLVKHVLSRELQLYYERLAAAVLGPKGNGNGGGEEADAEREAALASLRGDPGLHQLVPYLVQFVTERITTSLREVHVLARMLDVTGAILDNPTLFVEPYLHQLMPAVLTILLTSNLGETTSSADHYGLRLHAASLLALILARYSTSYASLKPRVIKTLLRALIDPNPGPPTAASAEYETGSMGTRYGAVVGLGNMGRETVTGFLASNLLPLGEEISAEMLRGKEMGGPAGKKRERSAKRVVAAVMDVFRRLLASEVPDGLSEPPMDVDRLVEKVGPIFASEFSKTGSNRLVHILLTSGDVGEGRDGRGGGGDKGMVGAAR
uniref:TATA box binding protein associated factor (TAF) histone-like fold domain-containing protein n=1 Tax=Bartheletia paradoxa TaxID=669517 RepID=A0A2D0XHU1_9BASI|nr:hypothetical protein SPAR06841 [Bartheletia paradoxa]